MAGYSQPVDEYMFFVMDTDEPQVPMSMKDIEREFEGLL
jgi:hypothetical protein